MSQFRTHSFVGAKARFAALAAIVGALGCFAAAAPASAAEVFLKSDAMYNPGTVTISGPKVNVTAYAGPTIFVADYGVGASKKTFDIVAFCVDIFHDINAGIGQQQTLDLQYHTSTLTQNGNGVALTGKQIAEVSGLVALGTELYDNGKVSDLSDKLAGVQGAIWKIENPTYAITGGNSTIEKYINKYVDEAPGLKGKVTTIYADNDLTQGFAEAVPEPGVWAMMIVGFGLIGLQLRRQPAKARTPLPAQN